MKGQDAAKQRVIESNMHTKLHKIGYGGTQEYHKFKVFISHIVSSGLLTWYHISTRKKV